MHDLPPATQFPADLPFRRAGYAPVENGTLFYREAGDGPPILLVHGGPDFDHSYFLPDMLRWSDSYRLIFYDQRGRGKSMPETLPDSVYIATEVQDLEDLQNYLELDRVAVLGHSWGGYLAMEYALHHADRISHLILMDTGPASHEDFLLVREEMRGRKAAYEDELKTLVSSTAYEQGDPDTVAAYYRIHFSTMIPRPEHLDRLMESLSASFTQESILRGRGIEDRLIEETWSSTECDLFPRLKRLHIPTLVLHGEDDVIPAVCAAHIAQAIPGARFALLRECGHFPYIESPDELRKEIDAFFEETHDTETP